MSSIDTGLTIDKMIEFAGVIRDVKPATIRTYQIEATGKNISGSDRADLAQELGEHAGDPQHLPRAGAAGRRPEQQFEDTTTTSTMPHATTTVSSTVDRRHLGAGTAPSAVATPRTGNRRTPRHCRTPRRPRSSPMPNAEC